MILNYKATVFFCEKICNITIPNDIITFGQELVFPPTFFTSFQKSCSLLELIALAILSFRISSWFFFTYLTALWYSARALRITSATAALRAVDDVMRSYDVITLNISSDKKNIISDPFSRLRMSLQWAWIAGGVDIPAYLLMEHCHHKGMHGGV